MIELTVVTLAWIVFAVAGTACVLVAARAVRMTPGLVGLVVLVAQQILSTATSLFAFAGTDPSASQLGFRAGAIVWLLWSPAVALAGALLFHGSPKKRLAWAIAAVTGGPNVVLLLASLARPSLLFAPDVLSVTPLAATLIVSVFAAIAAFALLFAVEALTTPLELRRAQFALLALAFVGEGMYHATQNAFKVGLGLDVHGFGESALVLKVALLVPFVAMLGLLTLSLVHALDAASRDVRRWAWALVAFLAAAGATGGLTAPLAAGDEFRARFGIFHALWDLASLLLLVFAGLRFQLFSLRMRARQAVAVSIAIAAGFLLFVVAESLAQEFVQDRYLGTLPANDVISGVVVALALLPLAKAGELVGRRFFPEATSKKGVRHDHEEIYQAAVEGALLDGALDPKEVRSLVNLRKTLGLTLADHDRIERRVRDELAASGSDTSPSVSPA